MKRVLVNAVLISVILLLTAACSSAPKRTMERTDISDSAYSRLEAANTALAHGDYQSAKQDFDTAYNEAISIDNADLLTKVCLSRISYVLVTQDGNVKDLIEEAKSYAARSSDIQRLNSLCVLYDARLLLLQEEDSSLSNAWNLCTECEEGLQKDSLYLAYLYRTRGEILLAQKKYAESEKHFSDAAELHIKERYLSEIALDWYFLARACAAQQKKTEAIEALEQALKYDRLDENTAGLGADYYALAVVLNSGNPSSQEKEKAKEYALFSAKIYAAGGFVELSEKSLLYAQQ